MSDSKTVYPSSDEQAFRMPIDEMFTLENVGLMVVGRIKPGSFKEGDAIAIVSLDKTIKTRVDGIDIRGDSVGIVLRNVTQDQIRVGMVVTTEGV